MKSQPMAEPDQDQRLHVVSRAGHDRDAHDPKELGEFKNSTEAWARRIQSGQAMTQMVNVAGRLGTQRALGLWADWTDRIAAGELPFDKPERPQGIERNIVLTLWDWSRPTAYLHDLIGTDRRNPRSTPMASSTGRRRTARTMCRSSIPMTHTATEVNHPVRDPKTPSLKERPDGPSPYWGAEPIWEAKTSNHNPMMDEKGRVWFTVRVRPPANPEWCKKGSDHPSAKVFPLERRQPPSLHVRSGDGQIDADLAPASPRTI